MKLNDDRHLLGLGIFLCYFLMGLIVLVGEAHWNRGLCLNNEGNGFVNPETYYSPCHALFSPDEFLSDQGGNWYFYKLMNSKLSSSIITWSCYIIHLFINCYIMYKIINLCLPREIGCH